MSQMKKIKLEDLVPERAEILIGGKEYHLRKFNVQDEAWLKQKFGDTSVLQKMMENVEIDKLAPLIYRLLEEKSAFPPIDVEGYDDDGNATTIHLTGPQHMLTKIDGGVNQKMEIYYALTRTIGVSQPLLDKIVEEELQKQADEDKKKENLESQLKTEVPAGEKSTNSLPENTDTP